MRMGFHVAAAALLAASLLSGCSAGSGPGALPQPAAETAFGTGPNACGWKINTSPNPGFNNRLNGVSASSASDVWAVGKYSTSSQGPLTLAAHFNGKTWTQVTTPNPGGGNSLIAVASVTAKNAWAVGWQFSSASQTSALILHYNGTAWKAVAAPAVSGASVQLDSIAAISATDIWAIGFTYTYDNAVYAPYALHYNGKKWTAVSMPNRGSYGSIASAVSAGGASDVWVTGGTASNPSAGSFVTFTEHWNGSKWSYVKSPNANSNDNLFNAAAAVSAKDAWAIGDYYTGTTFATLTEHWDGNAWKIIKSPNVKKQGNGLFAATALGSKDVWAAGASFVGSTQSSTLALHWNGTAWSISKTANDGNDQFNAIAAAAQTKTLYAAGMTLSSGAADQTLVEQNACGLF